MVKTKKFLGFTLIELLFVIAIMGVLITLGLSYASKQVENFKVKKAALQMQQILQAGMAYWADNNQWPSAGTTVADHPSDFYKKYIGLGITINPLPQIGRLGAARYYFTPIIDPNTKEQTSLFSVKTTFQSSAIAQRVAALLPNATVDDKTVTAQVGIPGQAIPGIRIIDYVEEDKLTFGPTKSYTHTFDTGPEFCSQGEPKIVPIILDKDFQLEQKNQKTVFNVDTISSCDSASTNKEYICHLTFNVTGFINSASIRVGYFVICGA